MTTPASRRRVVTFPHPYKALWTLIEEGLIGEDEILDRTLKIFLPEVGDAPHTPRTCVDKWHTSVATAIQELRPGTSPESVNEYFQPVVDVLLDVEDYSSVMITWAATGMPEIAC